MTEKLRNAEPKYGQLHTGKKTNLIVGGFSIPLDSDWKSAQNNIERISAKSTQLEIQYASGSLIVITPRVYLYSVLTRTAAEPYN